MSVRELIFASKKKKVNEIKKINKRKRRKERKKKKERKKESATRNKWSDSFPSPRKRGKSHDHFTHFVSAYLVWVYSSLYSNAA